MNYLVWALVALVSYSFVSPLVKIASSDIPSEVTVLVPNTMLVLAAAGVAVYSEAPVREYLAHPSAVYLYAAGVFLAVGIMAYYRAIEAGPISVVVPVFGMFLVMSSAVGVVVLDEPLTLKKALGIGFAVLAVVLTSLD